MAKVVILKPSEAIEHQSVCGEAPPFDAPCPSSCQCNTCTSCEPSCSIKTRVRDCIVIREPEYERTFKFNNGGCADTFLALRDCLELRVRQRGCSKVLTIEKPYRKSINGDIVFRWSPLFNALKTGYYEADIYRGCTTCASLCFYLPPCTERLTSTEFTFIEDCGGDSCLEVDQTNEEPIVEKGCTTC